MKTVRRKKRKEFNIDMPMPVASASNLVLFVQCMDSVNKTALHSSSCSLTQRSLVKLFLRQISNSNLKTYPRMLFELKSSEYTVCGRCELPNTFFPKNIQVASYMLIMIQ